MPYRIPPDVVLFSYIRGDFVYCPFLLVRFIGFGVFLIPADGPTYDAVRTALDAGYRHIDTAAAYFNEADVGRAVRDSGIPRGEIFVTSKLWLQDYGYEAAKKGLEAFEDMED